MREYSTGQVAQLAKIHKQTLLRWLYAGSVAEPKRQDVGGQDVRVWTQLDLKRVKAFKEDNYRKGRGRKKQTK